MSSGSVRLHAPVDLHQHDDPPGDGGKTAIPDGRGEAECCQMQKNGAGCLWREDGKVMYRDAAGSEPQAVRIVWARPLSERGGAVSVMQAGKKREVAFLPTLDVLTEESRRIAEEELAAGTVLPRITAIHGIRPRFGNYYWDVETDLGRRTFVFSSPENNHLRPAPDLIVIKDVNGNCFEINPVSGLSPSSKRELDRVL